ncbi:MAG: glycosyl transferase family 1 [Deltaproteobacteria bacterium RBG_13_60_28]|nr:MAG: glycosyl transferase family 1 [Deltaproteobacteria bacterium RBG_13_60_28]
MIVAGLSDYAPIVGAEVIGQLERLAERLGPRSLVHINSTRSGGGVAEILHRAVPLLQQLGLETSWEIIQGDPFFFAITKTMHNGLQGEKVNFTQAMMDHYLEVNRENARSFKWNAEFVLLHDPQPAPLIREMRPQGKYWIWRCHIDASRPNFQVWRFLREIVSEYDASVFSMSQFAQDLPHPQYLIRPSIDPLSQKNRELTEEEIKAVLDRLEIERDKPIILQVSRFDSFKDPLGVISAFRMVRRHTPCRLVLAGGEATDDPEGARIFAEVQEAAQGEPDIQVLLLPADAHHEINALQRAADIIVQKSTREGFGLTVTEAMWKGKPVIGGAVGGIVLQLQDYNTGFLVHTPEGCAFRIRYLLHRPEMARRLGQLARELVRSHFLITRTLRDYLTLMILLDNPGKRLIEL